MHENKLDLPAPSTLKGTNIEMPYYIVADSIFALHTNLMKPFAESENLDDKQRIYNYRISRARINIECAFGILTKRWAILGKAMGYNLSTCELICTALLLLHNFIITENLKSNPPESFSNYSVYTHDNERRNGVEENDERILNNSNAQRNILKEYFYTVGKVPWQENYIIQNVRA